MSIRPRRRLAALSAIAVLAVGALAACSSNGTTSLHRSPGIGAALPGVADVPAAASSWPQAGRDARHSGTSDVLGPQTSHVRWRRDLGGNVTPGPVIGVDGSVLAATNDGVLHAIDPASGRDRWTYDGGGSYGVDLSTSPAVITGGTVLWPGPRDTLFALTSGGRLLWSAHFGGQVLSPVIAGRDRVYVADLTGRLSAFEVSGTAHRLVWTLQVGGPDYAGPTLGPDATVFTAANHDLVAVRDLGSRGVVRWRLRTPKLVEVTNGIAADGTVVLGNNHDHEYGVAPDGSVRWSVKLDDNTYSSSVVSPAGLAYFGDNMGRLRVLDTADGHVEHTLVPQRPNAESVWSSAAVDRAGTVYWASTKGRVYAYDRTGRRLWQLTLDAASTSNPALDGNGVLYVGTTAGSLYAIGT